MSRLADAESKLAAALEALEAAAEAEPRLRPLGRQLGGALRVGERHLGRRELLRALGLPLLGAAEFRSRASHSAGIPTEANAAGPG